MLVAKVKPGGTGTPSRVISARPTPLPPRSSRMEPSPSTASLPKRYMHLPTKFIGILQEGAHSFSCAPLLERHYGVLNGATRRTRPLRTAVRGETSSY